MISPAGFRHRDVTSTIDPERAGDALRQFILETDPAHPPRPGDTVTLDREESHHLLTVLRGGRDTVLDLTDGRGGRYTGRAQVKGRKKVEVEILSAATDSGELAAPRLVLACAVVKGKRFEWALEKAVELGVHEVVPLVTDFTVVDPRPGKQERWRAVMTAAVKQSGRAWLPPVSQPHTLVKALAIQDGGHLFYGALNGGGDPVPFWTSLLGAGGPQPPSCLVILIGPEGGWSPAEEALLTDSAAQPIGLGPHVLRTETAAAAGLAVLQALRQEFLADG